MNLIAQAPLRSDAEAVADQEHPDHELGINRRPADTTVEGCQVLPNLFKITNLSIERSKWSEGTCLSSENS